MPGANARPSSARLCLILSSSCLEIQCMRQARSIRSSFTFFCSSLPRSSNTPLVMMASAREPMSSSCGEMQVKEPNQESNHRIKSRNRVMESNQGLRSQNQIKKLSHGLKSRNQIKELSHAIKSRNQITESNQGIKS